MSRVFCEQPTHYFQENCLRSGNLLYYTTAETDFRETVEWQKKIIFPEILPSVILESFFIIFDTFPFFLYFITKKPTILLLFPLIRFLYCHTLLYLHIRILNTNNCLRPVYADHCCFVFLISCFPDKLQQFLQYFLCQITASPVKSTLPFFAACKERLYTSSFLVKESFFSL